MEVSSFDVSRLQDYGVMGLMLLYFIWDRNTVMKNLTATLEQVKELVLTMKEGCVKK